MPRWSPAGLPIDAPTQPVLPSASALHFTCFPPFLSTSTRALLVGDCSLLLSAQPVKRAPVKSAAGGVANDIGVTPPLGLFDPLGFLSRGPDAYRRYQEIEIKHGRLAMAATLGVIVTEAGIRLPGALSISQGLDYADIDGSLDGAYFSVPLAGWAQIVAFIAALDIAVFRQVHLHFTCTNPLGT